MTTILEGLKYTINYPLTDNNIKPIAIKRGLDIEAELTQEIANSKDYELATADLYKFLVMSVNLSQGGAAVQKSDVDHWAGTANSIYKKYGEPLIGEVVDTTPSANYGYMGENF